MPAQVTLRAVDYRMTLWDRIWLAADEAGAIWFVALALVLVWQRPSTMTWGFFLYAIWFNPGQYFVSYAYLQLCPPAVLAQEAAQSVCATSLSVTSAS